MPEPLFILCPGRSFSSVVCAVIGQHPQCYGLPELYIFGADTLGELLDDWETAGRTSLIGLERTLAELHDGKQTEETVLAARAWIRANAHMTCAMVMEHIQELVGKDRILVEKSAGFGTDGASITRAVHAYPRASFIQLLRHPRSRGVSNKKAVDDNKRMRIFGLLMGVDQDYEGRWTKKHLQIHDLSTRLPPGQLIRIHGENFQRDLAVYLPQICEWLGIRADAEAIAAMMRPEDSPYSCVGPDNAKGGANRGFLENPVLDLDRMARLKDPTLDAPMDWAPDRHFSDTTRALAHYYGYR